jgi:6-phosphogluconolactonase/glucosamine-6-phosphate isomerase/deaminase
MATIFEAREVLLLASGANKAKAVAAGVEGEISDAVPPPPVIQRSAAYSVFHRSWTGRW